jgi:hypothetical protein
MCMDFQWLHCRQVFGNDVVKHRQRINFAMTIEMLTSNLVLNFEATLLRDSRGQPGHDWSPCRKTTRDQLLPEPSKRVCLGDIGILLASAAEVKTNNAGCG